MSGVEQNFSAGASNLLVNDAVPPGFSSIQQACLCKYRLPVSGTLLLASMG